jgi:hypothetical protein
MVDILSHPLTYVMAAILGFFLKDLFNKVQKSSAAGTDLEMLKARVLALEINLKEQHQTSLAVIRLEEQVKQLSKDIHYLLTLVRVQNTHDKTDAS